MLNRLLWILKMEKLLHGKEETMSISFKTFPKDFIPRNPAKSAKGSDIFGNRFHADQTLYEYLIEFLLIFVSGDDDSFNPKEKLRFHEPDAKGNLFYTAEPRMGLRRFIFFDRNKKNDSVEIDKKAYEALITELKKKIDSDDEDEKTEILESLQDLLHGYAVVLKKRSWCAQAMLPLCPELVFCEAMPANNVRVKISWEKALNGDGQQKEDVDSTFAFDKRNFLARGGEVYYLHLLQGMIGRDDKRKQLEFLLREQLIDQGKKMSVISNFIQNTWEEYMEYEVPLTKRYPISCIPEKAYINVAEDAVDELISFMSCKMHPVQKIELLAKGIMLQIMRMLSVASTNYLDEPRDCWIIDMNGTIEDIVKKTSADNLVSVRDSFTTAIGISIGGPASKEKLQDTNKVRKDSFDIFKSKGKELQCIIPMSGPSERFSLSEDCIRFLVLSIINPGKKMTLDMFLTELYKRYRIVIGPVEFKKIDDGNKMLTNSFLENLNRFQEFLKATGFLRELSDATSIVENPYEEIKGDA